MKFKNYLRISIVFICLFVACSSKNHNSKFPGNLKNVSINSLNGNSYQLLHPVSHKNLTVDAKQNVLNSEQKRMIHDRWRRILDQPKRKAYRDLKALLRSIVDVTTVEHDVIANDNAEKETTEALDSSSPGLRNSQLLKDNKGSTISSVASGVTDVQDSSTSIEQNDGKMHEKRYFPPVMKKNLHANVPTPVNGLTLATDDQNQNSDADKRFTTTVSGEREGADALESRSSNLQHSSELLKDNKGFRFVKDNHVTTDSKIKSLIHESITKLNVDKMQESNYSIVKKKLRGTASTPMGGDLTTDVPFFPTKAQQIISEVNEANKKQQHPNKINNKSPEISSHNSRTVAKENFHNYFATPVSDVSTLVNDSRSFADVKELISEADITTEVNNRKHRHRDKIEKLSLKSPSHNSSPSLAKKNSHKHHDTFHKNHSKSSNHDYNPPNIEKNSYVSTPFDDVSTEVEDVSAPMDDVFAPEDDVSDNILNPEDDVSTSVEHLPSPMMINSLLDSKDHQHTSGSEDMAETKRSHKYHDKVDKNLFNSKPPMDDDKAPEDDVSDDISTPDDVSTSVEHLPTLKMINSHVNSVDQQHTSDSEDMAETKRSHKSHDKIDKTHFKSKPPMDDVLAPEDDVSDNVSIPEDDVSTPVGHLPPPKMINSHLSSEDQQHTPDSEDMAETKRSHKYQNKIDKYLVKSKPPMDYVLAPEDDVSDDVSTLEDDVSTLEDDVSTLEDDVSTPVGHLPTPRMINSHLSSQEQQQHTSEPEDMAETKRSHKYQDKIGKNFFKSKRSKLLNPKKQKSRKSKKVFMHRDKSKSKPESSPIALIQKPRTKVSDIKPHGNHKHAEITTNSLITPKLNAVSQKRGKIGIDGKFITAPTYSPKNHQPQKGASMAKLDLIRKSQNVYKRDNLQNDIHTKRSIKSPYHKYEATKNRNYGVTEKNVKLPPTEKQRDSLSPYPIINSPGMVDMPFVNIHDNNVNLYNFQIRKLVQRSTTISQETTTTSPEEINFENEEEIVSNQIKDAVKEILENAKQNEGQEKYNSSSHIANHVGKEGNNNMQMPKLGVGSRDLQEKVIQEGASNELETDSFTEETTIRPQRDFTERSKFVFSNNDEKKTAETLLMKVPSHIKNSISELRAVHSRLQNVVASTNTKSDNDMNSKESRNRNTKVFQTEVSPSAGPERESSQAIHVDFDNSSHGLNENVKENSTIMGEHSITSTEHQLVSRFDNSTEGHNKEGEIRNENHDFLSKDSLHTVIKNFKRYKAELNSSSVTEEASVENNTKKYKSSPTTMSGTSTIYKDIEFTAGFDTSSTGQPKKREEIFDGKHDTNKESVSTELTTESHPASENNSLTNGSSRKAAASKKIWLRDAFMDHPDIYDEATTPDSEVEAFDDETYVNVDGIKRKTGRSERMKQLIGLLINQREKREDYTAADWSPSFRRQILSVKCDDTPEEGKDVDNVTPEEVDFEYNDTLDEEEEENRTFPKLGVFALGVMISFVITFVLFSVLGRVVMKQDDIRIVKMDEIVA